MPPRHAYWTILIGNAPTAFRAREREELLPTFERLRAKQPDAVMRWFERGRLWNSPDEARLPAYGPREKRGVGWRPGGTHRDPRERFKGPRDKGAKGPRDQGAKGPSDQGTKGPRDQGTKGPRDRWAKPWRPKGEGFEARRPKDETRKPWRPKGEGFAGRGPKDETRKPWRPKGPGFQGQRTFQGQRPKDEGPAAPKRDSAKAGRPKGEGFQGRGPTDIPRKPWRPKGPGFQGQRTVQGQRPKDEGPAAPKRDRAKAPREDRAKAPREDRPRRSGPRFPKKWQK